MSIWNERVKMAATALNNMGIAGLAAGVIAPAFTQNISDGHRLLFFCVGFATGLIGIIGAQVVLGFLREGN